MTKQLFLLTVPPDRPSRKSVLAAFKLAHGIETHSCCGLSCDRWMAVHMPSARKFGYGVTPESTLVDCVMKVGRLLDESGVASYGRTEAEAVRELCANVGIQCDL